MTDRSVLTAQDKLADLSRASWALNALAVACERGILDALVSAPRSVAEVSTIAKMQPATVAALVDVLAAVGFLERDGDVVRATEALRPMVEGRGVEYLTAELRSMLGVQAATLARARETGAALEGWRTDDPTVVRAQGVLSEQISVGMERVFASIPSLRAAFSADDATFLDVGAGAGGICIALARMFPSLRVVGLEPAADAATEARRAIAAAGVDGRVEIRSTFGQELHADGVFSVAYVAQKFMPRDVIGTVLAATFTALRPGGWLLTGATATRGGDLASSVSRWRSALWGGGPDRDADALSALLEAAGFTGIVRAPVPPGSALIPMFARRA